MTIFKDDSFFSKVEIEGINFPLYRSLRDIPELNRDRAAIENFFTEYKQILGDDEKQLARQLAQHPNSIIWQFSLMKLLERNGIVLEKAKAKGPDILARFGNTKICIEAVAAQMGKVPARCFVNGVSVEFSSSLDWRVVSRITQQLQTKIASDQTSKERVSILAVSAHGIDRAYLKKVMGEILFSEKTIVLPNGASIILNYGEKLLAAGYKFLIYTDHDPLIYLEDLERFLEIHDLENKTVIKNMNDLCSVMNQIGDS